MTPRRRRFTVCFQVVAILLLSAPTRAEDSPRADRFQESVEPLIEKHCASCHGYGVKKGGVDLDVADLDRLLASKPEFWWRVLKNVRAGIMPPTGRPRLDEAERKALDAWIKRDAFGIDPNAIDPGHATIRRLNRAEYRNTIEDLMGIDFRADEEFPPDDSGYGFDNIGDVLTVSPLLLEKYLNAAKVIVSKAAPTVPRVIRERLINGSEFLEKRGQGREARFSFYKSAKAERPIRITEDGDYRLAIDLEVRGTFNFDPGRCKLIVRLDGASLLEREYAWHSSKRDRLEIGALWKRGDHHLGIEIAPLEPVEKMKNPVDLVIREVSVRGPTDPSTWARPEGYSRFFQDAKPPETDAARREFVRETIARFAARAYRRPVEAQTLERLTAVSDRVLERPEATVEEAAGKAMTAILASPRFLFRVESDSKGGRGAVGRDVDEHSLASRLSYFLWSTMPDDELFKLAERGALRSDLDRQVERMLKSKKSDQFIRNFLGQWLSVRDIEGVSISAREVLRREGGFRFRVDFDREMRLAMRRETEMVFERVVRENRSVLDLIDGDYTYLNEALAKHYGIPDVRGAEMRLVSLPKDGPRGGILTHGSILAVTSNPTRTSPVKRGLFVLDNILGTPAPPAPPNIPPLEDVKKVVQGREATLRESLEIHRSKPLCSSCHSRMDPIGLALENFNAMGGWREKEYGQTIDPSGRLITGESFQGVRELRKILANEHRLDYYRCLTEKLLTYALGRGLEYYDVETVDRIVERLEREHGRFSALLTGVIHSSPFQQRRTSAGP